MKILKVDSERMQEAFVHTELEQFDFTLLKTRGLYIHDMEDVGELTALLRHTHDLQDMSIILDMLRVRIGAFLHRHPPLADCLQLFTVTPENAEGSKHLAVYITKLLRGVIEESTDALSTVSAYYPILCQHPKVLHTFMRLIGEKFFCQTEE